MFHHLIAHYCPSSELSSNPERKVLAKASVPFLHDALQSLHIYLLHEHRATSCCGAPSLGRVGGLVTWHIF